jgi:hypothetical protein
MEIVIIVGTALVLWYFKNAMTDSLELASEMSSKEMYQAAADQSVRHHNQDRKRTTKITDMQKDELPVLTAKDIIQMSRENKI